MTRRLFALIALLLASAASAGAQTAPPPASPIAGAMHDVERIRGLAFEHDVRTVTIDRAKLSQALRDQIAKSLPYSFDDYMLILTSLRLVEPGTKNPEETMVNLMQQQVLAFYDPQSHTYYSIDSMPSGLPAAAKLMGLEHAVAVHELTHALQDQHFGIGKLDFELRNDSDASLAFHSLIEGEASLVMLVKMVEPMGQTVDTLTANDQIVNAVGGAAAMMQSTSSDTPRYFTESLAIPYTAGLRFVIEAYRSGGWARVNRIYDDPPRSMREVLHPEEYLAGRHTDNPYPLTPPLPVPHLLTVEHLGEWQWRFLVGAEASRGWSGDRVTVSQDAFCNPTILVETAWDSPERARAFAAAYSAFLTKEKIEPQMRVSGTHVDVAYGTDDALIDRFIERAPAPPARAAAQ